ncbi:hypothetical protein [Agilicoccus flavus]|uniref:hypothetical protein n=1 Tax=Agilicoccus flavus TaxID=2775968 RepID=UPI001CF67673|nr:hypothetical protein [Agilicoccus flavus]
MILTSDAGRTHGRPRRATTRSPRVRLLGAGLLVSLVASACSGIEPESSSVTTPPPTTPPALTEQALSARFDRWRAAAGGSLALAWAPVGRPDAVRALGSVTDQQSWSTIKVPVALAAVRAAGGEPGEGVRRDLDLALTVSDNDAARRLWRSLGPTEQAARSVDAVLAQAGDATTRTARDGSSDVSFGLTRWSVPDAARFAAGLPCLAGVAPVWERMGRVDAAQRWGIGRVAGSHLKGGWGPSPHGYLMRQIGVVPLADGSAVAVAVATQPPKDSHPAGAAALDRTVRGLVAALGPADGGRCPAR